MSVAATADVLRALGARRFHCSDEAGLQRLVAEALESEGIGFQREKRMGQRDRLDFMIDGGVALELKVQTSEKSLLRQVLRYAEHVDVSSIIVAGTCHSVLRLPKEALGKPVRSIHLRSW